jgi:hypothetical protein
VINLVVKFLPLAMNATDAGEYIGSPKLFEDMRRAGWIKPCPNASHKLTLFDRSEIEKCYARFRAGEYPGRA